jgi:hypothetical protein
LIESRQNRSARDSSTLPIFLSNFRLTLVFSPSTDN